MTRFARAKGSKSSNEKVPEDSTPWEVMKEQLLQAKKESEEAKGRQEAEKQRIENYENFLKKHRTEKRKATWCEFPESVQESAVTKQVQNEGQVPKKKKKNKQLLQVHSEISCGNAPNNLNNEAKSKKKKSKQSTVPETNERDNYASKDDMSQDMHETQLRKKKKKITEASAEKDNKPFTDLNLEQDGEAFPSKKKNKKKRNQYISSNKIESNEITSGSEEKLNGNISDKKNNKNNKNKELKNPSDNSNVDQNKSIANKQNKIKALKNKKLKDGVPIRRKEINDHSFQLIINGKEVELVRFDGFPIMKKDAERIQELKNSMIKKGIPKSEVQRTIKLERRRAEKALARLKRDVCYNCRKGGHNLSDCPDLKSKIPGVDAAEGVCFKCGSTEHRQFECKVQRDKEFRFATCFICKEPGHIARQCPDNPKGLYPNGGACKLCGDVTHLRKDCPTINDKKEETSVKLQTLATSDNIEEMNAPSTATAPVETTKKPKKIKF